MRRQSITGSDNGLPPGRCQAIIRTNAVILLIRTPGTNFSSIIIEINTLSFKKIHLKMSSTKWRPFCLGLNVLTTQCAYFWDFLHVLPRLSNWTLGFYFPQWNTLSFVGHWSTIILDMRWYRRRKYSVTHYFHVFVWIVNYCSLFASQYNSWYGTVTRNTMLITKLLLSGYQNRFCLYIG